MLCLGCNWIEGTPLAENPLWNIAQEIGLKGASTNQEDEPLMFDKNGKEDTAIVRSVWARLNSAMAASYKNSVQRQWNGLPDMSLRESLTRNGWIPQTAMEKTAEFFYVEWMFEYGAEDVSLFNFFSSPVGLTTIQNDSLNISTSGRRSGSKLKRGMPRNLRAALARMGVVDESESPEFFVTDSRGYVAVMRYIADSYLSANDPRLLLNTVVTNIQYDESKSTGVTVTTSEGRKYTADYVICTFSAGVINKGDTTGLFTPSLPLWKRNAYAKAQMGTYTKVFLKFNEPFWDDWVYTLYADSSQYGFYPVWQNMQALGLFFPNDTNVFMVTVVNSESDRIETQSSAGEKTFYKVSCHQRCCYSC
jgi:polyamine oxidase